MPLPSKEMINEDWISKIQKQISKEVLTRGDWYDIVSINERKKIDQHEKSMHDILKEFKYQQEQKPRDPVDKLRDEMHKELNDIKKAIHTIGILLDSDKPSDEMLEKHKTLRDAYRKYKMIEALILGQQK